MPNRDCQGTNQIQTGEGRPPCKNFGDIDIEGNVICYNQSDPRYTMDFTDVEPGAYIYWCEACGPEANVMNDALINMLQESPELAVTFEQAINSATIKRSDA